MNKYLVITGGAGFIGSNLIRYLLKKTSYNIISLDDYSSGKKTNEIKSQRVKYIHGNYGRGTFSFYGGHDPEDYRHGLFDPHTQLELHKNSPGYRLILNNVLFPAAKKKEQKT